MNPGTAIFFFVAQQIIAEIEIKRDTIISVSLYIAALNKVMIFSIGKYNAATIQPVSINTCARLNNQGVILSVDANTGAAIAFG